MNKLQIKLWLKSAAGIVSAILLIVSIILIILGFSPWGNFTERTADNINNILFGFATNLIGIIVTISFVQYFFDKQNIEAEQKSEKEKILRFDRIMRILIGRYVMYFNTVTTPMENRTGMSIAELNQDFRFTDMRDIYKQSLFIRDEAYKPAIKIFYEVELELRKYCISLIEHIDFKYNQQLSTILTQFIEKSIAYNVREAILGNIHLTIDSEKYSDVVIREIGKNECDWVKEIHADPSRANMMTPYVCLYDLLNIEKDLINQYLHAIAVLENTALG